MNALLEVAGVSVSFDGFKAVNALSFAINACELRAIIGPNGAGKTTFMDLITGKTRADAGSIVFGDLAQNLIGKSESKIAQLGIGRKFQRPTVFEAQSVHTNLSMALKNKRNPWAVLTYFANTNDEDKIVELAKACGLGNKLQTPAGILSHGQKQWLEIAMLLAQDPQLLLVDEPAAGMTVEERQKTVTLLKSVAETRAVIVVEHDMEFVRALECKVTVLHEGSVLAEGSLDHVSSNEEVIEVYLGR